jgi:hypothetical protein
MTIARRFWGQCCDHKFRRIFAEKKLTKKIGETFLVNFVRKIGDFLECGWLSVCG